LLSTDGQLEPSHARFKGCAYACRDCQQFRVDEASRLDLGRQLHSGEQRLLLPCPFPEVVDKVRQATTKKGHSTIPKVVLLEMADVPEGQASSPDRQQVATLLGLPEAEVPSLRLTWCHLSPGSQGDLLGHCPVDHPHRGPLA
jgi:hypothetical protein